MRYTIKNGKSVSHHGPGRVVAVVTTTTEEGPEGVGLAIDAVGVNGLRIKLAVEPADFDDEASCVQLLRLAERIRLMASAAANRRSAAQMAVSGAGGDVP